MINCFLWFVKKNLKKMKLIFLFEITFDICANFFAKKKNLIQKT